MKKEYRRGDLVAKRRVVLENKRKRRPDVRSKHKNINERWHGEIGVKKGGF